MPSVLKESTNTATSTTGQARRSVQAIVRHNLAVQPLPEAREAPLFLPRNRPSLSRGLGAASVLDMAMGIANELQDMVSSTSSLPQDDDEDDKEAED